ncbi:zinc uptake regulation protein [Candidatus Blochmanniella chromaiodes str. 640]|uniref:Ferric uptake regulation protein n=1 Tax=Candidatus Blochmanniella chromaiodes str. 640 TaxID=1240471 RepID=A0ABN4AXI5_9ENTR|nr:zinc uptake transcriptional repressor Zur [Candidatus Blochmannia chromaiodes]AGC03316.1 zinc uptake regulation protein [Candidatus Blochmannia chromaiodes str. 640]
MNTNIQKILTQIKKLCEQRCVRLTPQRLAVLRLISQYNGAISAYDLLHLLRQSSLPHAKPSTIYRALNFLLAQGFIHRIESTNSFMLCRYFFELSHNFAFFICKSCKQVTEQTTKGIEEILQNTAKITGFTMFNNVIEAHGLCPKCIALELRPNFKP